ncbi:TPA: tRNA pseudouridine(38-40) synthase TruA [Streptococcus agalactiae]
MTRYKAQISYDGSAFSGFQRQPNCRTVQEEIERTLKRLNSGNDVIIYGAGRTDAGVHAYGQVIHFDLPQARDVEKLRFGLDTQCPDDIDIVKVEQVSDDFHCRYDKHIKTYEFLVDIGRPKNPMMRNYATHYPYPVIIELMQEAIKDLVGTHDFTGFTASGTSVENKVRTIFDAKIQFEASKNLLIFTFTGNGFLYKQVRNMVGTLLKIGNGRMPISQIKIILQAKNRDLAGPTAAGNGLYLKEIIYEDEECFSNFRK